MKGVPPLTTPPLDTFNMYRTLTDAPLKANDSFKAVFV